ncbi:MAG: type II toxin-antitoxin system VapB family antitoxin [Baekduia sp.]
MALNIKDPETSRLARELAATTGETITEAARRAFEERLARLHAERTRDTEAKLREVRKIQEHFASLPIGDDRTPDEIIGYDEHGLPT